MVKHSEEQQWSHSARWEDMRWDATWMWHFPSIATCIWNRNTAHQKWHYSLRQPSTGINKELLKVHGQKVLDCGMLCKQLEIHFFFFFTCRNSHFPIKSTYSSSPLTSFSLLPLHSWLPIHSFPTLASIFFPYLPLLLLRLKPNLLPV